MEGYLFSVCDCGQELMTEMVVGFCVSSVISIFCFLSDVRVVSMVMKRLVDNQKINDQLF